jgi:hypothetical protein
MKVNTLLFVFFSLLSFKIIAQTPQGIKGVVVDKNGPVQGAHVILKATADSDETNFKGEFFFVLSSIDISLNQEIIVIVYKNGYKSKSYSILPTAVGSLATLTLEDNPCFYIHLKEKGTEYLIEDAKIVCGIAVGNIEEVSNISGLYYVPISELTITQDFLLHIYHPYYVDYSKNISLKEVYPSLEVRMAKLNENDYLKALMDEYGKKWLKFNKTAIGGDTTKIVAEWSEIKSIYYRIDELINLSPQNINVKDEFIAEYTPVLREYDKIIFTKYFNYDKQCSIKEMRIYECIDTINSLKLLLEDVAHPPSPKEAVNYFNTLFDQGKNLFEIYKSYYDCSVMSTELLIMQLLIDLNDVYKQENDVYKRFEDLLGPSQKLMFENSLQRNNGILTSLKL